MRRRQFIGLLGGAAVVWPRAGWAQQQRVRRIGILTSLPEDDEEGRGRLVAFRQGLQQLGWVEGRNIQIAYGLGGVDPARLRANIPGLLPTAEVILAGGSSATSALQQATQTVPIVFVNVVDPVGAGFVDTLAQPGGNITGFTNFEYGMSGKWLEILKEIVPRMSRVAVLRDPTISAGSGQLGALQSVASSLGVELHPLAVKNPAEIERGIAAFLRSSDDGLIVTEDR
jgi:putative ABC transport system substrate-binding protein